MPKKAAAQLVTRLVFNLGFENTGKVLNRFEPGFDPLCLQEVRQSLEKESKVRPGMPAADFKVFDREGKEYTLASFKGKYIFLEFSGVIGVRRKFLPSGRLMNGLKIVWCLSPFI